VSMSNGSRVGFRRGSFYCIGLAVGQIILLGACAVFCSLLSEYMPMLESPLRLIGAGYLLWLAWHLFRSDGQIGESREQAVSARALFLRGVMLQFVNPKFCIYAIVSMELYILPGSAGDPLLLVGILLLFAVNSFFCCTCWLLFGSLLRRLFSRYGRIVNTVMALLLAYCAVSLFL